VQTRYPRGPRAPLLGFDTNETPTKIWRALARGRGSRETEEVVSGLRHCPMTVENLAQADALLFGRVTYEMMEAAWRPPAPTGARPDWMEPWMEPFARTIDAAKKYVVSSTLDRVDWNAELVHGDLGKAVQQLKRESGKGLFVGGVKLPLALAELGLIDEYEFVVQPRLAGHGPTLFAGLSKHVDLKLVSRLEFGSGAVAMRYEPRR
jgi:dihydrofolate reductase